MKNKMHVLLIKLTSMGDILHILPAITDAVRHVPNLSFDWVIDKKFEEIASWHPAICQTIQSSHRNWRKRPLKSLLSGEISRFLQALRKKSYDLVVDGQTNHKSALISLLAKGVRVGLDKHSSREYIAHFAYQKSYNLSRKQHAISLLRYFFSQVFEYPNPLSFPDFGIDRAQFKKPLLGLSTPYYIFIHAASWKSKLWSEKSFLELSFFANKEGYLIFLPWGSEEEKRRAERIAKKAPHIRVLPKLSLSEIAYLIERSKGVVSVDTGLSHLAGALDIPTVTLYGPTTPDLIGTIGKYVHSIEAPEGSIDKINPRDVWEALKAQELLKSAPNSTLLDTCEAHRA